MEKSKRSGSDQGLSKISSCDLNDDSTIQMSGTRKTSDTTVITTWNIALDAMTRARRGGRRRGSVVARGVDGCVSVLKVHRVPPLELHVDQPDGDDHQRHE